MTDIKFGWFTVNEDNQSCQTIKESSCPNWSAGILWRVSRIFEKSNVKLGHHQPDMAFLLCVFVRDWLFADLSWSFCHKSHTRNVCLRDEPVRAEDIKKSVYLFVLENSISVQNKHSKSKHDKTEIYLISNIFSCKCFSTVRAQVRPDFAVGMTPVTVRPMRRKTVNLKIQSIDHS